MQITDNTFDRYLTLVLSFFFVTYEIDMSLTKVYKAIILINISAKMSSFDEAYMDVLLQEEQCLLLAICFLLIQSIQAQRNAAQKKTKKRKIWVRSWLAAPRRELYGQYAQLLQELHREDPKGFKNFLRVPPELFHDMVQRVSKCLQKQRTWMREPLSPAHRLAITLRFLATGESYTSLQYNWRVAHNTISKIVTETCIVLIRVYIKEQLACPKTPDEWKKVATRFSEKWQFHNCLGALDGKHIAIKCPANSGTFYFNYKHFFSIVLLALVDADYKFLYIDIGANGSASDAGIFVDSEIYHALNVNTAGLPPAECLPSDNQPLPYAIVGDDAFGLRTWMMKPFPNRGLTNAERIFNYRLSRARRVVENAFGILAHR